MISGILTQVNIKLNYEFLDDEKWCFPYKCLSPPFIFKRKSVITVRGREGSFILIYLTYAGVLFFNLFQNKGDTLDTSKIVNVFFKCKITSGYAPTI